MNERIKNDPHPREHPPPTVGELLAIIRRIAETPLWGEAIDAGPLRDDYFFGGEYDAGTDQFNPSCDTESSQLREVVELARLALIHADSS